MDTSVVSSVDEGSAFALMAWKIKIDSNCGLDVVTRKGQN
jgi:hypothetical protein